MENFADKFPSWYWHKKMSKIWNFFQFFKELWCSNCKICKMHWKLRIQQTPVLFRKYLACLQLLCAHLCTDLHKIWNLSSQDSIWPPHKYSWRCELSLRRYLQNNTGDCLILNFQCILHIFTIWASKICPNLKLLRIFGSTISKC